MSATRANAGNYVTIIPNEYAFHNPLVKNHHIYLKRDYLNELPPPSRIQDKRRIRIRYNHIIEMGQTKIHLRLKATPKPRKFVQIELHF